MNIEILQYKRHIFDIYIGTDGFYLLYNITTYERFTPFIYTKVKHNFIMPDAPVYAPICAQEFSQVYGERYAQVIITNFWSVAIYWKRDTFTLLFHRETVTNLKILDLKPNMDACTAMTYLNIDTHPISQFSVSKCICCWSNNFTFLCLALQVNPLEKKKKK
eukprot:357260_1